MEGIFRNCENCKERKMLYPEYRINGLWYCKTCHEEELDDYQDGYVYL